jgi:multidrug efflux pump subunit AcrA (membrane-fusion protein)
MRKHLATISIVMILSGIVMIFVTSATGCGGPSRNQVAIAEAYSAADQQRSISDGVQAQARSQADIEEAKADAISAVAAAQAQIQQAKSMAEIVNALAAVQINAQNNQHALNITYANGQVIEAHLNGTSLRYIAEHSYRTQDRIINVCLLVIGLGIIAYLVSRGIAHSIPDTACKLCPYRHKVVAIAKVATIEERSKEWD